VKKIIEVLKESIAFLLLAKQVIAVQYYTLMINNPLTAIIESTNQTPKMHSTTL
jgi:hypothetical protein